jgi:uncharacterized protein (DUF427 family)
MAFIRITSTGRRDVVISRPNGKTITVPAGGDVVATVEEFTALAEKSKAVQALIESDELHVEEVSETEEGSEAETESAPEAETKKRGRPRKQ